MSAILHVTDLKRLLVPWFSTDALPLQWDSDLLNPQRSFYPTWVPKSNKRKVWPFIENLICTQHTAGHFIILTDLPIRWTTPLPLQKLSLEDIKLFIQGHTVSKAKARIQSQVWPQKPCIFAPMNHIFEWSWIIYFTLCSRLLFYNGRYWSWFLQCFIWVNALSLGSWY